MRKMTRRNFLKNSTAAAGMAGVGHTVDLSVSTSGIGSKSSEAGATATFYVAPNGNDGWSGKLAEPNLAKTDGPFATLERARDGVRELKGEQRPSGPIAVVVRGGKYYLDRTLVLGPEDSGSQESPISYRAYEGEKPVLSGGKRVTGWKPYKGRIVQAELAGTRGGKWKIRQLFLNGERQIRSRYPKLDTSNPLYGGWAFMEGPAEMGSRTAFIYKPGTFRHRWAKPTEAEVIVFPGMGWVDGIGSVKAVDESRRIITLTRGTRNLDRPPWFSKAWSFYPGSRFRVENLLEELDLPGEWCLDSEEGIVYFWPPNGAIQSIDEIVAPALETLVDIEEASWVVISGFTFTETTDGEDMHRDGLDGYGPQCPTQGYKYCGEALHLREAEHCVIEKNYFYAVGGNAIYVERYNARNVIRQNEISQAGANGICLFGNYVPVKSITESLVKGKQRLPMFNEVVDNYIHHCGVFNKYVSAISLGVSDGNLIAHNRIEYVPLYAINLGRNGFGRNVVEYNEIHQVCLELNDNGAINSWMDDESDVRVGHVIRFNLITDVQGCMTDQEGHIHTPDGAAHGIYLDDNSSNNVVYGNVIVRASATGIVIHGGQNNLIENNIIVYAGTASPRQVGYWPGTQATFLTGNQFCRNIVYFGKEKAALVLFDFQPSIEPWSNAIGVQTQIVARSEDNVFFRPDGGEYIISYLKLGPEPGTRKLSLGEWRELGYDTHSEVGDPLFVDPLHDDYRLKPESPAFRHGFLPIDMSKIGIRRRD
jgi:parallel beta-helix repeat protein